MTEPIHRRLRVAQHIRDTYPNGIPVENPFDVLGDLMEKVDPAEIMAQLRDMHELELLQVLGACSRVATAAEGIGIVVAQVAHEQGLLELVPELVPDDSNS